MTERGEFLSLTRWTEEHLRSILNAKTEAEFDEAFKAFISKHASITLNGKHVSRETYKKRLQGQITEEVGTANVEFNGTVEVPEHENSPAAVSLSVISSLSYY